MKKIIVDKTEGIAEVIDRILNEPEAEITIVIPRGSALGKSARNFALLKREVDGAGKDVSIESVDEVILAFAKENSIEASHPLWRGVRDSGGVSDIVARSGSAGARPQEAEEGDDEIEEEKPAPAPKKRGKRLTIIEEQPEKEDKEVEEKEMEEVEEHDRADERDDRYSPPARSYPMGDDDEEDNEPRSRVGLWVGLIVLVLVGGGLYVVGAFFNRADVTINFKKTPWEYSNSFVADKAATQINSSGTVVPAQVFTSDKNMTVQFHASGVSNTAAKAHGALTIYNNYSSASQELVVNTRFMTPDGKIFRLMSGVTVPGATVAGGKVTAPGTITTQVVADQAGADYNVAAVDHLSIPGFQGTAKANGFYGALPSGTAGGSSSGQHAVPTQADITAAKASTTAALQNDLASNLASTYPNNFKILDGATTVQLTKLTVNTSTDQNGNFTVFAEGTVSAIGFDEGALKTYLLSLAQTQEQNSTFNAITLNYSNVSANFTKGQVSFSLAVQASLEPAFSVDDFKSSIAGKSIGDARQAILALPELADGKISVWPFWLWSIPGNSNKIHITAN